MYVNKKLLITGGTGSFGKAVLKKFIDSELDEIRIYSRDEKKQDDMRNLFKSKKLKFYLGDVKDFDSLDRAVSGVDYIFHAAALKQVPSCEFHPLQAIYTNTMGTANVVKAALKNQCDSVVMLSTDKAVYPINAMGQSKALGEKILIAESRDFLSRNTKMNITRYGNVMLSRGSVIPLFVSQVKSNKPITITDPKMTRYLMSLEESVALVELAFSSQTNGEIYIQKSPAATMEDLANAIMKILNKKVPIEIIGTRHGEKLYETLVSREEMSRAQDLGNYYKIPMDERDQNYQSFYSEGDKNITSMEDYTSHNTYRLTVPEICDKLMKLGAFKDLIND